MPGALARRSTRRLAMLGGVFVLLAVMLVPPLRAYLVQQQEYRDLQQTVAEQQTSVTELQQRKERWDDPAFVEQQARDRLRYVRPGETAYVVVGAESLQDAMPRGSLAVIDPFPGAAQPWYDRVWESIRTGDRMGTDPDAAPVSRLDGGPVEDRTPTDVTTGAPEAPERNG